MRATVIVDFKSRIFFFFFGVFKSAIVTNLQWNCPTKMDLNDGDLKTGKKNGNWNPLCVEQDWKNKNRKKIVSNQNRSKINLFLLVGSD